MKLGNIALVSIILFVHETLGVKINLNRKYPNVKSGVYQLDNKGRPIKIVDVNYNHIWELPEHGDVNSYSIVKKNGKVQKFSEGTNIKYGTTKRMQLDNVEEEEDENEKRKNVKKFKAINNLKNAADVSKSERDIEQKNLKKRRKNPPRAMHIEAEDVPEEKKNDDDEEIDIANDLGDNIRESIERHYDDTTPSSLSNELLDSKIPVNIKSLLMHDLEERKWISKKPISDKVCIRDYSTQCPVFWEKISDTQCISHKDYSGPCSHIMTFEPLSAKEKSVLGAECKVNWVCLNESCGNSERDYSKECPENWKYTGKCEAPENYSGGCNKTMDFGAFTQHEKEEFSATCKVVWPCKHESCERDYSITCPKGWAYNVKKEICTSDKESRDLIPEDEKESISHMSYDKKVEFSVKYGISWPCKNKCTYGYDIYACPRGWINLMDSGLCKSPDDYNPPMNCPRITHFDYMSSKEKENFSKHCNVKWLCSENSQRDYSKCPIYFDYLTEGTNKGMCQPNDKYEGPCKEAQDILSLNLTSKYDFEETCECQFPIISKEDIPQTDHDTISPTKLQKLLKGADTSKKEITLE